MLGKRIKKYRKEKGITQKELAKRIGKSYSLVQKYELDITQPPLEVIIKIADVLEVPIEELLKNTNTLLYNEEERKKFENVMDLMVKSLPQNKLIAAFDKLNEEGQNKAVERVEELTEIPKYKK